MKLKTWHVFIGPFKIAEVIRADGGRYCIINNTHHGDKNTSKYFDDLSEVENYFNSEMGWLYSQDRSVWLVEQG